MHCSKNFSELIIIIIIIISGVNRNSLVQFTDDVNQKNKQTNNYGLTLEQADQTKKSCSRCYVHEGASDTEKCYVLC